MKTKTNLLFFIFSVLLASPLISQTNAADIDRSKETENRTTIDNANVIYGILYDKSAADEQTNFRLFRFKKDGTLEILGTILPPDEDATIETVESNRCIVTLGGDLVFKTTINIDGVIYSKNAKIKNIAALSPSPTIKPVYFSNIPMNAHIKSRGIISEI